MGKITRHSKERLVQRDEKCENFAEAKKLAKQARRCGATINQYQRFPKFFAYLQAKRDQTNTCSIRIYRGNIYIWRGKNSLVTALPIPDRFIKEMEEYKDGEPV